MINLVQKTKLSLLICLMILAVGSTFCLASTSIQLDKAHIPFIQNMGQTDSDVTFYAQTFVGTVFVTRDNKIVYALPDPDNKTTGMSLKESFTAGRMTTAIGQGITGAKISHLGREIASNIGSFEYVSLGEVFDNIEVKLRAYGNNVEKLFFVRPDGDPSHIALQIEGANELSISSSGELAVETDLGVCSFSKPVAYQDIAGQRQNVDVAYCVTGNTYGFTLGSYNRNETLVIDPLLASTFLGGNDIDEKYEPSIALDNNGFIFFTGETASSDFPTTTGAYDTSFNGNSDRVISKFTPDLTTLVASTFIGGVAQERGMGICFDDDNNVFIAGYTRSNNLPITPGAYDATYNGGSDDAFIVKMDNDLTTVLAATLFGGSGAEGLTFPRIDLAMGHDGNLYVAGLTNSSNLRTNSSSYQRSYAGDQDIFVAKFTPDLTTLLKCTYLGGPTDEWRPSIQIDSVGNIFIGGTTRTGFPTTEGAFCRTFSGGVYEAFVAKLSGDLSELLASTYLGSDSEDNLKGMRVDAQNNVYVTGLTQGSNFPTTFGAFDSTFGGGLPQMFVTKFNNNLSTVIASTFVGGSSHNDSEDVFIDHAGNVHITGFTNSLDFPTTADAYDSSYNGVTNGVMAVLTILDANLQNLVYSTYIGGGADKAKCVVVDDQGASYIAGYTYVDNFPTTPGCFDSTFNAGTTDCFLAKIGPEVTGVNQQGSLLRGYKLGSNYPNPFNPITNITYTIPQDCSVSLSVYDLQGRLVSELVRENQSSGDYSVRWNGCNSTGAKVSSGVYTYQLIAGNYSQNRRMNLVK